MNNDPAPGSRFAACRAVAISLLSLGALLAAIAPHAEASTCVTVSNTQACLNDICIKNVQLCVVPPNPQCDPTHPLTCCEPLGIQCGLNCQPPLTTACCILQNPTHPEACTVQPPCDLSQPQTCCPPQVLNCNVNCQQLPPIACCVLNGTVTTRCVDCPPTTIGNPCCLLNAGGTQGCVDCRNLPASVCCTLQNPTNPQACNPPPPPPPPQCPPGTADLDNDCDCGTEQGDPADACVPPPPSASCLADAVLVTQTDILGGDLRSAYSESVATATGQPGPYTPPPSPGPQPPANPQAHADAHQATFHYDNSLLSVDAQGLHSRCDVDSNAAGFTDAYGRGGVADLSLGVAGQILHLDAVDFEEQALGTPAATTGFWSCDGIEAELNPPPSLVAICNFGISANLGVVSIQLNEVNAPYFDPAATEWVYQGSHLHIRATTAVSTLDIYVGYVRVGVTGGPAAFPTYTGHVCTTVLCS